MANRNSKVTLYEMASKVARKKKTGFGRVENMPPRPDEVTQKVNIEAKLPRVIPEKKPLLLSYRRRRNLITRPFVVLLIAMAVLIPVWMFGTNTDSSNPEPVIEAPAGDTAAAAGTESASTMISDLAAGNKISDSVMDIGDVPPTVPAGDHVIVLAHYISKEEFDPVIAYFAEHGIETVVEKRDAYYVLLTKDRYHNPNKRGTDGYTAREMIKKVGADYKAPQGYKGFGFSDIYGDKVD